MLFVSILTRFDTTTSVDVANEETGESVEERMRALIGEMRVKLGELEQLKDKEQSDLMENAERDSQLLSEAAAAGTLTEPADKDYALRQAQMQYQLTEYDSELLRKQVLFQKMMENNKLASSGSSGVGGTATVGASSSSSVNAEEMRSKIESLEAEKADLLETIRVDTAARKLVDQKRERLKFLESEVLELKRKEKEATRVAKLREENERNCERLRQEIVHIKQERVKLIKQMKSDTDAFRKYKQEKEKEVSQLKAMERKRLVEISKLQEGNCRQEAVLRRKNEEITRIQRQLRETSEKQKQVAEKRQQAFDRKESSLLGERLRVCHFFVIIWSLFLQCYTNIFVLFVHSNGSAKSSS